MGDSATIERPDSAVNDHLEAESERSAAEADAALAAQAAQDDLDADPSQVPPGDDPPADPDEPEPDEPAGAAPIEPTLELDGQLSFSGIGGKQPTSASLRLTGGKITVPMGQLKKGEDVVLRVVARVSEIAFVDDLDATTKQAVGCERRHKLRVLDVGLLEE